MNNLYYKSYSENFMGENYTGKNYCMQALKRECRGSIIAALLALTMSITFQIVFILNFRNGMASTGKTSDILWLFVIWIILLIVPIMAIVNCYKKVKDKENTTLVQYIRKQFPESEHSRDIKYIFNILNSDLANERLNIGNFYFGNEWMIGSSTQGSVAVKYSNIQKFSWRRTRIDSDKSGCSYKYKLMIGCLCTTFEFDGKGIYEAFIHLQNTFPEREYTRDKARDDLKNIYHSIMK